MLTETKPQRKIFMKTIFNIFFILLSNLTYGQNGLKGSYKLIAVTNNKLNTTDSTRQERGLTINFQTDTSFTSSLSRNRCWGNYRADKDKIKIQSPACTKMCCDNEYDIKYLNALGEVETFIIQKDTLKLQNSNLTLIFID